MDVLDSWSVRGMPAVTGLLAVILAAGCGSAATTPNMSPDATAAAAVSASGSVRPAASPTPSAGASASARADGTPGASVFHPGSLVVTVADRVVVRSQPRVSGDSVIYQPPLPIGTQLQVIGGPVDASGYRWYEVVLLIFDLDGNVGRGYVAIAARDGTPWVASAEVAPATARPGTGPYPTAASSFGWTRLAPLGPVTWIAGPVSFAGGYVFVGSREPFQEPVALYSPDGISWTTTSLANWVTNCPGWGPAGDEKVPDADVAAIATNGREIIITGALHRFDAQACGNGGAITGIAWRSSDGRHWVRSSPFRAQGPNERADAAWAMPTGWQALTTSSVTSETTVWASGDGLGWRVVSSPRNLPGSELVKAAPDGTILLSHRRSADSQAFELLTSRDGNDWTMVAPPAGCERPDDIAPPSHTGLDRWLLSSGPKVCSSVDLVHWTTADLGEQTWVSVAQTAYGALAIATHCIDGNAPCETEQVSAYLSTDATHWLPIAVPPSGYLSISHGSSGTIGVAAYDGVWRLEP